jgi:hypothetical protein
MTGLPIDIAPRAERAHEGNPEITAWCTTCNERAIPMRDGTCGFCGTILDLEAEEVETAIAAVPDLDLPVNAEPLPEASEAEREDAIASAMDDANARLQTADAAPSPEEPAAEPAHRSTAEIQQIVRWRRTEIRDWVREQGAATTDEIRRHFDLTHNVAQRDVEWLRANGLLVKTGRSRPGPKGGRPSHEFEAVEDALSPDGSTVSAARGVEDPPEQPSGSGAGGVSTTRAATDEVSQPEPSGGGFIEVVEPALVELTIHQQLTVRYIGALIGWIERSSIVRDQGPPLHVYDRIERLLEITDGVS